MPTLPSPGDVTQAQQDRIIAAFNNDLNEYRTFLRRQLVDYVVKTEQEKVRQNYIQQNASTETQVRTDLNIV